MASTRNAALRTADLGDSSGLNFTSGSNVKASSFERRNHASAPRCKALAYSRSRPFVVEDDVIIISSDSEDDVPRCKSTVEKSKVENQRAKAVSEENTRPGREVQQLLCHDSGRGRKRPLKANDDEQQDMYQRLHKKTVEMQAENERIRAKLVAAEKAVKNLKKRLGNSVNVESLGQQLECEICLDIIWQPWTMSDCGHTICQTCLISFFNTQKYECPKCRVAARHPPVQNFALKSLVRAIAGPVPPEFDVVVEDGHMWDMLPRGGHRHGQNAHANRR